MTFHVGDWVRRKPEFQNLYSWGSRDAAVQVEEVDKSAIAIAGEGWRHSVCFDLASAPIDHHALGMALELAGLLYADWLSVDGGPAHPGDNFDTADWLRARVTRELLGGE